MQSHTHRHTEKGKKNKIKPNVKKIRSYYFKQIKSQIRVYTVRSPTQNCPMRLFGIPKTLKDSQ